MIARDYVAETKDNEARKYFYNFDYDVMHPFMLRSFLPFMKKTNALELGCFEGAFSQLLEPHFNSLTCIEASIEAAAIAKQKVTTDTQVICGLFEETQLDCVYDNIFMCHVLEHVEDRVAVLKKIHDKWLSENGYFFLVCPNANAASRQIATKMGLISHNAAVTNGESEHGHHITYSLDTLERDAREAGFNVVERKGIFFKAFANFQFDKILNYGDVINEDYLEGCFQLGNHYPDLCSSIFLLCEKGR